MSSAKLNHFLFYGLHCSKQAFESADMVSVCVGAGEKAHG